MLDDRHVLTFGYAAYSRRQAKGKWRRPLWLRFTSRKQFWDWADALIKPNRRLYMFAHNVGYDAPVLGAFTELPRRGWTLDGAIIEGPPTILTWRWRGRVWRKPFKPHTWRLRRPVAKVIRTLVWIDTLNIWKMPLARLGASLGMEKLAMPEPDASRELWDAYGKRDTEIIMEACIKWWQWLRQHDLGGFAPTIAGQAFRAFRHRFMPSGILIDDNPAAQKLARDAMHGGRTECHTIGEVGGPVEVVDVNAQYPAIMRKHKMPMYLLGVYSTVTLDDIKRWLHDKCVVADVELDTDEPAYGVVHEKRLVFPVGRLRLVLTTPELVYAQARGHISRVHSASVYSAGIIFRSYVDYFHGLRLQAKLAGDDVADVNAKLMGNSLFGKFGQAGRRFESIGECEPHEAKSWVHMDLDAQTVTNMRALGGLVQSWVTEGEAMDSHPAIAAHITAYGRIQIWELAQVAGMANVHYMDTDSLFVTGEGLASLKSRLNPTKLGALKHEGTHSRALFRGPKDYELGDMEKIKGIRKQALKITPNTYAQTKFTGLKGLVARGDVDAPIVGLQQKTLTREYHKGTVGPDGRVSPLRLDAW